jgi:hypothetical protein
MKHPELHTGYPKMKHPEFHTGVDKETSSVSYRVSTMKRPDFDVLKTGKFFSYMLRVSCILQEFKFPPKL